MLWNKDCGQSGWHCIHFPLKFESSVPLPPDNSRLPAHRCHGGYTHPSGSPVHRSSKIRSLRSTQSYGFRIFPLLHLLQTAPCMCIKTETQYSTISHPEFPAASENFHPQTSSRLRPAPDRIPKTPLRKFPVPVLPMQMSQPLHRSLPDGY